MRVITLILVLRHSNENRSINRLLAVPFYKNKHGETAGVGEGGGGGGANELPWH